jgi:hypothetical protein
MSRKLDYGRIEQIAMLGGLVLFFVLAIAIPA